MLNFFSSNLFYYILTSAIWGSTWLVIVYQIQGASPLVSVFYRFLLSGIVLMIVNAFRKQSFHLSKQHHLLSAVQGVAMFSINYMLTYVSESMIPSGFVALAFTALVYFNMFGIRFVLKRQIRRNVLIGAVLGFIGIALIFNKEIREFSTESKTILGILVSLVATLAASIGNLFSVKLREQKVPINTSTGYGMLYGSAFTLFVCLVRGENFAVPLTTQFVLSLAYLSIFGSVIAFSAYLSLVGRMGAEKAAYVSVISPIIALTLSSVFENLQWTPLMLAGAALAIIGNIVSLR